MIVVVSELRLLLFEVSCLFAKVALCVLQEAVYKKANLSGAHECISASDVISQLVDKINAIIDLGNTYSTKGSTIIDLTTAP